MKRLRLIILPTIVMLLAGIPGIVSKANSKAPNIDHDSTKTTTLDLTAPLDYAQQVRFSETSDAWFGKGQVAVSGNTAVVAGTAGCYVYVRSGIVWSQQAVLVPSDGATVLASPGIVALQGDTIVIGGPSATVNSNVGQGAAYVFVRNGTTWSEQQRLTASDGAAGDGFGRTIAIDLGTVVVGANRATVGGAINHGAAYAFIRSGTTWTEQAKLLPNDGAANKYFGTLVRISGESVVVSLLAFSADSPVPVYVFARNGAIWSQQQRLSACEPSTICDFGTSISIDGDTLAVGRRFLIVGGNDEQGGVYVFFRSGTVWSQQQRLTASDGQTGSLFGAAVSVEIDTLLVGSPGDSFYGASGAAYTFARTGSTWDQQQRISVSATRSGFGQYASMSGNTLLIASQFDTGVVGNWLGAAYVYASGTVQPTIRSPFDFDGDGKSDAAVYRPSAGDWYLNRSTAGFGAFHFGSPSDIFTPADYTGDGKTDMAVFRPSEGTWYVLRSEDYTFYGAGFGAIGDIPSPRDFDADGRADTVVFRPSNGTWYLNQSTAGFNAVQFGQSGDVPAAGDFDGDGKNDISVYRPSQGQWFRLNSNNGSFYGIQFGTAGDQIVPADYTGDGKTDYAVFRPSTSNWYILRSENNTFYGGAFGSPGDLPSPGDYDGDGKADLAVWRPGTQSIFYIMGSTSGFQVIPWGIAEDRPVANAYVY